MSGWNGHGFGRVEFVGSLSLRVSEQFCIRRSFLLHSLGDKNSSESCMKWTCLISQHLLIHLYFFVMPSLSPTRSTCSNVSCFNSSILLFNF